MRNVILFSSLLITIVLGYYLIDIKSKNIAVFNYDAVFDEFKLKKELEGELRTFETRQKNALDSIKVELEFLSLKLSNKSESIERQKLDQLIKTYQDKQDEVEENVIIMANNFNAQIKNKLDDIIIRYREEKGIDLLIVNSEKNPVLFSNDNIDKTKEIIEYVNKIN